MLSPTASVRLSTSPSLSTHDCKCSLEISPFVVSMSSFTTGDAGDLLGKWVVERLRGVDVVLILCGRFPIEEYPKFRVEEELKNGGIIHENRREILADLLLSSHKCIVGRRERLLVLSESWSFRTRGKAEGCSCRTGNWVVSHSRNMRRPPTTNHNLVVRVWHLILHRAMVTMAQGICVPSSRIVRLFRVGYTSPEPRHGVFVSKEKRRRKNRAEVQETGIGV